MRCLILGGTGFIGSAICDRLINEGHRVRILARHISPTTRSTRIPGSVDLICGDFLNYQDLRLALRGIDVVFHLISTTVPKTANDDPIFDVQTNLIGTLGLLEALKNEGVGRIIFASSGGTVYGIPHYLPIDEHHQTNPLGAYGITKLAIEKHLKLLSQSKVMSVIILRVSNPYGTGQKVHNGQGVIRIFLQRILSEQPVEIWGDGEIVRDYIYVSDVAEAFVRAMEYAGEHTTFNVGSGKGLSLNTLVAEMEEITGKKAIRIYKPPRSFDVPVNVLDVSKISRAFGWIPRVSVNEGLQKTLHWLKACQEN